LDLTNSADITAADSILSAFGKVQAKFNNLSGFVWRGAWSNATAYSLNHVVHYQGAAWIAIQAGTNHAPAVGSAYWSLVADKGATGADGLGYSGALSSTQLMATGLITVTIVPALQAYQPYQRVRIAEAANKYIEGVIVTYDTSTGEMQLTVDRLVSSGTLAAGSLVGLSGDAGAAGAQGPMGATPPAVNLYLTRYFR
jgi:hypothetical protein